LAKGVSGKVANGMEVHPVWRVKGRVYTRLRLPPHSVTAPFLAVKLLRLNIYLSHQNRSRLCPTMISTKRI
jgi:hypothetical protein